MSQLIKKLEEAQKKAMSLKPKVNGFPVLAEVLNQAGVLSNQWSLPSGQSIYVFHDGAVIQQGPSLSVNLSEVPEFNREELIRILRADQQGMTSFLEFLKGAWDAGVISYEVDFKKRKVIYYGFNKESYSEDYPAVSL